MRRPLVIFVVVGALAGCGGKREVCDPGFGIKFAPVADVWKPYQELFPPEATLCGHMALIGAPNKRALNIDFAELRAGFVRYLPLGALVAIILAVELIVAGAAWSAGKVDLAARAAPAVTDRSNIQQIGELLYTRYIFLFEAAGIVLLVAMIGAIVLTHRQRGGVRTQNISLQNQRRPQDATRLDHRRSSYPFA